MPHFNAGPIESKILSKQGFVTIFCALSAFVRLLAFMDIFRLAAGDLSHLFRPPEFTYLIQQIDAGLAHVITACHAQMSPRKSASGSAR